MICIIVKFCIIPEKPTVSFTTEGQRRAEIPGVVKDQHGFISFIQNVMLSCFPFGFDLVGCVGTRTEQFCTALGHVVTITIRDTTTAESIIATLSPFSFKGSPEATNLMQPSQTTRYCVLFLNARK